MLIKIGTAFSVFWVLSLKCKFGFSLDISPINHVEIMYGLQFRGHLC